MCTRECLEANQGVTLKVSLGGLLGDPFGKKEGRRDVKIGSTNKGKDSLALEKGHFKRTRQCLELRAVTISTGETKN